MLKRVSGNSLLNFISLVIDYYNNRTFFFFIRVRQRPFSFVLSLFLFCFICLDQAKIFAGIGNTLARVHLVENQTWIGQQDHG